MQHTQKIYLKWYCCDQGVPMLELENICFDVCTDGKIKQILKNIPQIAFIVFQSHDVVRNPLVGKIIDAYERKK